jgi:hypothetical protein
MAVSVLQVWH